MSDRVMESGYSIENKRNQGNCVLSIPMLNLYDVMLT